MDTTTYYEFGLRWEIYSLPPRLCEIRRDGDTLSLVFDQRLGAESAKLMKGRELKGKERSCRIAECRWDGNLLRLKLDTLPAVGEVLTVPVGGVAGPILRCVSPPPTWSRCRAARSTRSPPGRK